MEKNGSIRIIKEAIDRGRPATTDVVPGTVLHHFLYKSRRNVQFTMSSFDPEFTLVTSRRRFVCDLCLSAFFFFFFCLIALR